MRNPWIRTDVKSEQDLMENLMIEALQIYGQDIYYLPRDLVNVNTIFQEDVPSSFNSSYLIEMYIDNIEGFDGEGDIFSKFGVEIRDQATFTVSRRRWRQTVQMNDNEITGDRPREGDLLWSPMTRKLFEITAIIDDAPFYQLHNFPTFKLTCQLFEYSGENFDTNVDHVQDIEEKYAYTYILDINPIGDMPLTINRGDIFIQDTGIENTVLINNMSVQFPITINAEVLNYNPDNNELQLIHLGRSDGNFAEFRDSDNSEVLIDGVVDINRENAAYVISSVGAPLLEDINMYNQRQFDNLVGNAQAFNIIRVREDNKISASEQNDTFIQESDGIFDFEESNPFGNPLRNIGE